MRTVVFGRPRALSGTKLADPTPMGRLLVLLAACTQALSPLSLDVHYAADRQPLAQAAALGGVRVGVARFKDARPLIAGDIHARSYVAHDTSYHVGMTWNGRTFTPVAEVTQGLLVAQLQGAGLNVRAAEAEVEDAASAKIVAQRDGFDVVLGGSIREFSFKGGQPTVSLEVLLFRAGGDALLDAPLSESRHVDPEASAQARVDEVLDRSFRPVARNLVAKIADQLAALVAAEEKARAAEAQAAAEAAVVQPSPSPAPPPPPKRHRKRN
jgi:hypothetical protein